MALGGESCPEGGFGPQPGSTVFVGATGGVRKLLDKFNAGGQAVKRVTGRPPKLGMSCRG